MKDTIFLHDLRIETVVGIWDWERDPADREVDLEMGADIRRAAGSDSIDDTLNYKAVAKRVQQFVEDSSFQLVETLAEKVAALILDEFAVPWVRVRVNRPGDPGARDVGVRIRRSREPGAPSRESRE